MQSSVRVYGMMKIKAKATLTQTRVDRPKLLLAMIFSSYTSIMSQIEELIKSN